jgi:hypothetical protein
VSTFNPKATAADRLTSAATRMGNALRELREASADLSGVVGVDSPILTLFGLRRSVEQLQKLLADPKLGQRVDLTPVAKQYAETSHVAAQLAVGGAKGGR